VLLPAHADLLQDPHRGEIVREAAGGDPSNAQPVERVRHHDGDSLGRVAVAAVGRIEDVAELGFRPRWHAGLTHTVDHLQQDGSDHHAVEGHRHAVVVGILRRLPPRRAEGRRVDLGAYQPAIDLRQVAVLQDPIDVLVTHRAKLQPCGPQGGALHERGR
jgi:hypothetical protein